MDKYFLYINEPCTEDWNSMTVSEKGKFCSNCNKTVFDFTTATDGEIMKHIEAMKGEIFCGRFEENQLDRWLERSDIKKTNPRLYKFLMSFILLGAAQDSHAQNKSPQENVEAKKKLDSLLNIKSTKVVTKEFTCDTTNKIEIKEDKITRIRSGVVSTFDTHNLPLIIVDGKSLNYLQIKKLDPNKIITTNILNVAQSIALYGSIGANGALIITTSYTKKQLRNLN